MMSGLKVCIANPLRKNEVGFIAKKDLFPIYLRKLYYSIVMKEAAQIEPLFLFSPDTAAGFFFIRFATAK